MIRLLREKGYTVYEAESRLENTQDVAAELDKTKPDYVIDAAGLVSSLLQHVHCRRADPMWIGASSTRKTSFGTRMFFVPTRRVNVVGTVALADACWKRKIPCTTYATGCIYEVGDSTWI